jgi:hypothetical protein
MISVRWPQVPMRFHSLLPFVFAGALASAARAQEASTYLPSVEGRYRTGYGSPDVPLVGVPVWIVWSTGRSATPCRGAPAKSSTDESGRFRVGAYHTEGQGPVDDMAFWLCVGVSNAASSKLLIPVVELVPTSRPAPAEPLVFDCRAHGDGGSPECRLVSGPKAYVRS